MSGLITKLDRYVLQEAIQYTKELQEKGIPIIPISINFSRISAASDSFVNEAIECIENSGLDRNIICIEVTESALATNAAIKRNVEKMRNKGIRVLMDDFGSGYSSLSTFSEMDFDILKADMGFMGSISKANKGKELFKYLIQFANTSNLPSIAEGVETIEQLKEVINIGISYIQGYILAKPMPKEYYEKVLVGDYTDNEYLGESLIKLQSN